MAQVECPYTPAYSKDELGFTLLGGSFAGKSHDIYVVYDDVMDQIIIRLVNPRVFASEYYVDEDTALLVRDSDREVIGFTIVNFQSEFLPKVPKLNDLWGKNKLAEHFQDYRKTKYEPRTQRLGHKTPMPEQPIVVYSAYQSKAAAALVTA
jgi:hypothetical protein